MGIHDELYKEGAKLGFAKGGQVKDPGVMPASKGDSQQEIEAGGRGRLKPGYKKGGKPTHNKKPLVGKKKLAKGGGCEVEVEIKPAEKKKAGGKVKHTKRTTKHKAGYEKKAHGHRKGGSC